MLSRSKGVVTPLPLWIAIRSAWCPSFSTVSLLHRRFRLEVFDVAEDRSNCQHFSIAAIAHEAISTLDVALDFELVPFLRVPDVVDGHVVMLAPEERHVAKPLPLSKHIPCSSLA